MTAAGRRFPHVVIRASAGTGKTFQLSNRFVGLASAGEPLDAILATTFTRKAAGEILDRVLLRLADAALDEKELAELARHVEDPSLDRAGCLRVLREMFRQLHRLRVGTLDSFFLQVARSFSLELGLPPGWQIVDEIVDGRLRAEAVRAVLQDESTGDAVELMFLLTKGEASRSVGRQIAELVGQLYGTYTETPAEAWQPLTRRKPLPLGELKAALDALADVELPDGKTFAKARQQDLNNALAADWKSFIAKGIAAKILHGESTFRRQPIPPQVIEVYRPLVENAKAELVGQIANQTAATHKLLERFDAAYRQLKLSRRAMRFEDVTARLTEQTPTGETPTGETPTDATLTGRMEEVAFRLDAHLRHLLLDEFQDTAPGQWRVLRPFARRIVRHGGRQSFFCVGDVKQAIYGWRGGVAEIFEALDHQLEQLEHRRLDRSRRSCQVVIDTVNRVFGGLESNAALGRHPDAAGRWAGRFTAHTTARDELPGYCRMVTAPAAGEGQKQDHATLAAAATEVEALHRRTPGMQIGVLVRTNEAVARLIFELRRRGLAASEEGGNPLTDSPAVQLLLSLLTLADHPGDTAARFHVANSPLAGPLGLDDHTDAAAAVRLAHRVRRRLISEGYGALLYDWVTELAPWCDRRQLGRLLQLVELAHGYQPAATTRTDDFVALAEQKKVEDPSCAAVRVMTVHQAKGLQFDIVVLPQLDAGLTGQPPLLVVDRPRPTDRVQRVCRYVAKDLRPLLPESLERVFDRHQRQVVEESLCVLYVAMTRAVHALHLIVAPSAAGERNVPTTSAGLLRTALSDAGRTEPQTVLYEHGDPDWSDRIAAKRPQVAAAEEEAPQRPPIVRLAEPPERASRGLQRRSPSQLEGGPTVNLAHRLRLDTAEALDRGSLVHAWFEQIEWLDDGTPDRATLLDVAQGQATQGLNVPGLNVPGLIDAFHVFLEKPSIRAALTRETYRRPAHHPADCTIHAPPQINDPHWTVWRERPFVVRDGEAILRGTIDRLVVLYDGDKPVAADVLDFKTDVLGPDDPAALEARVEEYRPQLDAYRRAVAGLFNLQPSRISARLALLELGIVRAV